MEFSLLFFDYFKEENYMKAYKVVDESMYGLYSPHPIRYVVGKRVSSNIPGTGLFVFTNLKDARRYAKLYKGSRRGIKIYLVEAEEPIRRFWISRSIRFFYDLQDEFRFTNPEVEPDYASSSTCRAVTLIKRVSITPKRKK